MEVTQGRSTADLAGDRTASEALLWNFTVLGEAAGKVSHEMRTRHPEIAWQRPVDLRNRIVHGYWSIDLDVLVTTARRDIPALGRTLEVLAQIGN